MGNDEIEHQKPTEINRNQPKPVKFDQALASLPSSHEASVARAFRRVSSRAVDRRWRAPRKRSVVLVTRDGTPWLVSGSTEGAWISRLMTRQNPPPRKIDIEKSKIKKNTVHIKNHVRGVRVVSAACVGRVRGVRGRWKNLMFSNFGCWIFENLGFHQNHGVF